MSRLSAWWLLTAPTSPQQTALPGSSQKLPSFPFVRLPLLFCKKPVTASCSQGGVQGLHLALFGCTAPFSPPYFSNWLKSQRNISPCFLRRCATHTLLSVQFLDALALPQIVYQIYLLFYFCGHGISCSPGWTPTKYVAQDNIGFSDPAACTLTVSTGTVGVCHQPPRARPTIISSLQRKNSFSYILIIHNNVSL